MVRTDRPPTARGVRESRAARGLGLGGQILDERSLLHVPGTSGLAGDYQGRDAIVGLLDRIAELAGGTFRFAPTTVVADDERALVVVGRVTGSRAGGHVATDAVHVASLQDGLVREVWIFYADQDQVDALWS